MSLLGALAPALQQLPASLAELEIMQSIDHDEMAALAAASLKYICDFLIRRKQLLQSTTATTGSSCSSAQQVSALPQDGLLLTLAELQPNTADTWLLPVAVPAFVTVLNVQCPQLNPVGDAAADTAAGTAVADAVAAPVLLQLGPAVMQHLKEAAAVQLRLWQHMIAI
jgi:hypothetical protein